VSTSILLGNTKTQTSKPTVNDIISCYWAHMYVLKHTKSQVHQHGGLGT